MSVSITAVGFTSRPARRLARIAAAFVLSTLLLPTVALAQRTAQDPAVYRGVDLVARLGTQLPLGTEVVDEAGQAAALGSFFDGRRPVVLTFVYYRCPMLCSLVMDEYTRSLAELGMAPGEDFVSLAVSIDPRDTPEDAVAFGRRYEERLGPESAADFHFLTGTEDAVRGLAEATGFTYRFVDDVGEYVHPSAVMFASATGRLTRVMHGIGYDPSDLRRAVIEASAGTVGSPLERALMFCFQFDPTLGAYTLHAVNLMKAAGLLTILVFGLVLGRLWHSERHTSATSAVTGEVAKGHGR